MSDCIFCMIIGGQIPSAKVAETDDFFAFRDISPQAPQHILVVPKRHIERLDQITESDSAMMGRIMLGISRLAHDLGMDNAGYRVVVNNGETAGQSVWHLHFHLMSGRSFQWPPG